MSDDLATAVLLIIDVQRAIDDPRWAAAGPRNNPGAEANIAALLAHWRNQGRPVIHVRHDSGNPDSSYYADGPGRDFKPEAAPLPGEAVVSKRVHSAFVGTDLEARLRADGVTILMIAGVITNNSVETTVRHAGNLGFDVRLVEDACFTFARRDHGGVPRSAQDVHDMSLANMDGEYCRVVRTLNVLNGGDT